MEQTQFEKSLADLRTGAGPVKHSQLTGFSDMSADQMKQFREVWPAIDTQRKHQVISRMVALAEEDVDLDFDRVFEYCINDADEKVRTKAIEGLWEYHGAAIVKPLLRLLRGDPAESVRAAAATSLARFALMAELQELHPSYLPLISDGLLTAFKNQKESLEVRRRALEALAPLTLPAVAAAIREAYSTADSHMKASAVYAMGQNCDPAWLSYLFDALEHEDATIRFAAAGACGECGEEQCVPRLAGLLQDEDVQVRLAAVDSLGRIGSQQAKAALTRCLKGCEDEEVRAAAGEALEEIKLAENPFRFGQS